MTDRSSRLADLCTTRHLRMLRKIARRVARCVADEDDIVSYVCCKWCETGADSTTDRENLFMFRLALHAKWELAHTSGQYGVKDRPEILALDIKEETKRRSVAAPQIDAVALAEIAATLLRLPAQWQDAVTLAALGHSHSQIARRIGVPLGNIHRWLHSARLVLGDPDRLEGEPLRRHG